MLGVIVTGHGEFSLGLRHATHMIAGEQAHVEWVPFLEGAGLEEFQGAIQTAVQTQLEKYNGVVVFTDLKGGTPFNVSMMATHGLTNVAVLSGTNLPMLIEGTMLSQFSDEALPFAEQIVQTGKNGIEVGILPAATTSSEDDLFDDEGI